MGALVEQTDQLGDQIDQRDGRQRRYFVVWEGGDGDGDGDGLDRCRCQSGHIAGRDGAASSPGERLAGS
jgi:hypothetical protein